MFLNVVTGFDASPIYRPVDGREMSDNPRDGPIGICQWKNDRTARKTCVDVRSAVSERSRSSEVCHYERGYRNGPTTDLGDVLGLNCSSAEPSWVSQDVSDPTVNHAWGFTVLYWHFLRIKDCVGFQHRNIVLFVNRYRLPINR